jgi:hypothetical protein
LNPEAGRSIRHDIKQCMCLALSLSRPEGPQLERHIGMNGWCPLCTLILKV